MCLGNICRSPLAEGIFKHIAIQKNTLAQFEIDSAGTSSLHEGELPDLRTRKNAQNHGIFLNSKSRPFKQEDFYTFDYILVMDDNNLRDILKLHPYDHLPVQLLKMCHFDLENKNRDVPDPWYGGEQGFEDVFQILLKSCHNFYNYLENLKA